MPVDLVPIDEVRVDPLPVDPLPVDPASSNSMSGSRNTMPSSPCMACTSTPNRSRILAATHSAHGACTCAPKGE